MTERICAAVLAVAVLTTACAGEPAATLVESVRARVKPCSGGRAADQVELGLPLAEPQGVDEFYAHREANQDPGVVPWSCHAVVGRGTLITVVVASSLTLAAGAHLTSVTPIFAETFAKA